MKLIFYTLLLATILGISFQAQSERLKNVELDDTRLCYPATFSPDTSFMDALLAPIADELDSSEGQELIYIPASYVKARVPKYTLSHINRALPLIEWVDYRMSDARQRTLYTDIGYSDAVGGV